ncbi:MAG TPA: MerR family transcriptional regulator [Actinomycetes bacterium]|nr:MerR family transcriptional regulator [Actinomycetes bacterium]
MSDERLTVDELARRSGTVSSTVRLYQSRGLLPPPERSGRMAFYGPGHLARMRLIGHLQERGFSLAAIKELVEGWEAGRDLAEVLGLEERAATWTTEEPVHLRLSQLRRRLPSGTISPAVLRRAIKLGLLQPQGRGFRVASPKLLDTGVELVKLGIPIDAVLDEYERLQQTTADIAAHFTNLFEQHLWQPFAETGMPPEQVPQLTATLQRLGPLAESVVTLTLRHALQRQAATFVAKQAAKTIHPRGDPR